MQLIGTDKNTFTSDIAAQKAVTTAFAACLDDISSDDVRIVNVTEVARRRLSHPYSGTINLRAEYTTLAAGLAVTLEFRVVLEALGLTVADSAGLYASISTQATAAVTSGTYAAILTTQLSELGSTSALSVIPDKFSVGEVSVLVVATPSPSQLSTQSTQSPSSTSSFTPSSITVEPPTVVASVGADAGLSLGATVGIVVATTLLFCFVLGALYYRQSLRDWNSEGTHSLSSYRLLLVFAYLVFLHTI